MEIFSEELENQILTDIKKKFDQEKNNLDIPIEELIKSFLKLRLSRKFYLELSKKYNKEIVFGDGGSQTKKIKELINSNIDFIRIKDPWKNI